MYFDGIDEAVESFKSNVNLPSFYTLGIHEDKEDNEWYAFIETKESTTYFIYRKGKWTEINSDEYKNNV